MNVLQCKIVVLSLPYIMDLSVSHVANAFCSWITRMKAPRSKFMARTSHSVEKGYMWQARVLFEITNVLAGSPLKSNKKVHQLLVLFPGPFPVLPPSGKSLGTRSVICIFFNFFWSPVFLTQFISFLNTILVSPQSWCLAFSETIYYHGHLLLQSRPSMQNTSTKRSHSVHTFGPSQSFLAYQSELSVLVKVRFEWESVFIYSSLLRFSCCLFSDSETCLAQL